MSAARRRHFQIALYPGQPGRTKFRLGNPDTTIHKHVTAPDSTANAYAEEANRINGETIPSPSTDRRMLVFSSRTVWSARLRRGIAQRRGLARKISPALAAGGSNLLNRRRSWQAQCSPSRTEPAFPTAS